MRHSFIDFFPQWILSRRKRVWPLIKGVNCLKHPHLSVKLVFLRIFRSGFAYGVYMRFNWILFFFLNSKTNCHNILFAINSSSSASTASSTSSSQVYEEDLYHQSQFNIKAKIAITSMSSSRASQSASMLVISVTNLANIWS